MNTAQELGKLSGADFELLMSPILRNIRPEFFHHIPTGINKKGRTRKDPIDGFTMMQINGKTVFVLFEHTTDEALERKWLHEPKQLKKKSKKTFEGDLIKAAKLANLQRENFPEATFKVVLCTSQAPNSELILKVLKKAKQLNLEVGIEDIIEIHKIVDFLDSPKGEWIREKYLKIKATRLSSIDHLKWMGTQTLELFKGKFFHLNLDNIIHRDIEDSIITSLHESNVLLIGDSGFGKSITSYNILEALEKESKCFVWIDEDCIREASSLSHAIFLQFLKITPNLHCPNHFHLFEYFKTTEDIYVVIDDINKSPDVNLLFDKIASWIFTKNSKFKILCTLWSKHLLFAEKRPKLNLIKHTLGKLSKNEAYAILHKAIPNATSIQIQELAFHLNHDPLLIGIYLEHHNEISLLGNPIDTIQHHIDIKLDDFIDKHPEYIKTEIQSAILDLMYLLLSYRTFKINFPQLQNWFSKKKEIFIILKKVSKDDSLFKFDKLNNLIFRHDRVRDALLTLCTERILLEADFKNPILFEPHYAELVGQAICKVPVSENLIDELIIENPLFFIETLKYLSKCKPSYQDIMVQKIKTWIDSFKNQPPHLSLVFEMCWLLQFVDSPFLLEVTENLPRYSEYKNLARFRNGDVREFAEFLTSTAPNFEVLSIIDWRRNEFIEIAKKKFGNKIVEDLKVYLVHPKLKHEGRIYFILAAGMIKGNQLYDGIYSCWKNAKEKSTIVAATIWALLINFDKKEKSKLLEVVEYWIEHLDYKKDPQGNPVYGHDTVAQQIKHGWEGIILSDDIIEELITWLSSSFWKQCLALDILSKQDNPKLLKQLYKNEGYWQRVAYSYGAAGGIPMLKCKNVFFEIYSNKDSPIDTRELALYNWLHFSTLKDLSVLKSIESTRAHTNLKAVWRRVRFGDRTIHSQLKKSFKILYKESRDWVGLLQFVWDLDFKKIMLEIISEYGINKEMIYLTSQLPPNDASTILLAIWEKINTIFESQTVEFNQAVKKYYQKSYENFGTEIIAISFLVPYSLCNGDERLLIQIKNFVEKISKPEVCFSNFSPYYFLSAEFSEYGCRFPKRNDINFDDLNRILPFIKYFDFKAIGELAVQAIEYGYCGWAHDHLNVYMPYIRQIESPNFNPLKYFPTERDVLNRFDDYVNDHRRIYHFEAIVLQLHFRNYDKPRIIELLKRWFLNKPSIEKFRFVKSMVSEIGIREDAYFFSELMIEGGDQEKIKGMKNEMIFEVKRRSLN